MIQPDPKKKKFSIESILSIFTECRSGEGALALLMTLNIFLILTSYLLAKVLREPLILSGGGAEIKSYASAIQVILLVGILRLYGWLVAKYDRRKLINYVTLFFVGCMIVFYLTLVTAGPWGGIVYFLWVGIFSLVIIAQFWSYANDIYSPEQGKRLFVLLAFGASAGGVFGPMLASVIIDLVGLYQMLLVAAGILILSLFLTNYIENRMTKAKINSSDVKIRHDNEKVIDKKGALKTVFRSKYLLMIAIMIMLLNWVNTNGEYVLGKIVENTAQAITDSGGSELEVKQYIGKFYSEFFTIVGFAGLLLQLFAVSRIIKLLGIRVAIMILPCIALGGNLIMALFPFLSFIRWSKTAENATDYSLNNTVRHILFLPTTKEEKYKAKVAIDSFFVRAGDVLSAVVVFAGVTWLSFEITEFAIFNVCLVGLWVWLAFKIGKENRRLEQGTTE
ncbi:MAG: MFS transporter [candidate division Zixibacteria bacterium]|nr:MFS transporter [candidate division Zixibacteria bacterium]